ncbi:MAG: hypothetical protein WA477_19005, partial [Candidatus Sulfotelmatobacter sp.]
MRQHIRITLLLTFGLLLFGLCSAILAVGEDVPKHLTHDQAFKDTKTFLSLLESTHPDPYTNLGGKVEFKRKAEKLVRDLPADGLSVPELTERLGEFLAPLRDG